MSDEQPPIHDAGDDEAPEGASPPEAAGDSPDASSVDDLPGDDLPGDDLPGEDESAAEEVPAADAAEPAPEDPAPERKKPEWKPPPPERLEGAIEALLLVAGDVVRVERLRDLLGLQSVLPIREAVAAISERWAAAGLAFEIEQVAGGVRVVTRPEYAEYVGRLSRRPASDKLSRAQLETLCIVAYKQPVGRAEVERVRGVQAGDPLRALLERRLLKVVGRSEQPGRPLLYGTTQLFLTAFGLNDLKDLPAPKDLQKM